MGWEIKKANNTQIFSKSLSPNHRECCGQAHKSVCGWVWVCFRVKFSFAALWLLSPCQKNSVFPRSQTQVKSAVLLKETRYKLKPKRKSGGKRNCLGGYIITEVLASSPWQALTTWLFFRKCKWHIALLCDISVSQLVRCLLWTLWIQHWEGEGRSETGIF